MNLKKILLNISSLSAFYVYNILIISQINFEKFIDNERYSWLYYRLNEISNFSEIYFTSATNLGMFELLPIVVFKTFSNLNLEYQDFIILINLIFLFLISDYLRTKGTGFFLSLIIILSSFYVFKLCFTLHKLKIAVLLFLILNKLLKKSFYNVLFVSFLGHFQFLIILTSKLIKFSFLKRIENIIGLFFIALIVYFLLLNTFIQKFTYYFKELQFTDFMVSLCIILISSFLLKKREFFELFLISISTLIFGNSRINILIYGYIFDKTIKRNLLFTAAIAILPNIWFWFNFSRISV